MKPMEFETMAIIYMVLGLVLFFIGNALVSSGMEVSPLRGISTGQITFGGLLQFVGKVAMGTAIAIPVLSRLRA